MATTRETHLCIVANWAMLWPIRLLTENIWSGVVIMMSYCHTGTRSCMGCSCYNGWRGFWFALNTLILSNKCLSGKGEHFVYSNWRIRAFRSPQECVHNSGYLMGFNFRLHQKIESSLNVLAWFSPRTCGDCRIGAFQGKIWGDALPIFVNVLICVWVILFCCLLRVYLVCNFDLPTLIPRW